MKIKMDDLVKIIREELSKFVDVDPDQLSVHDVINDEEGPEMDAWERPDDASWISDMHDDPVQHKRPSVERERNRLRRAAGLVKDY